MTGSPNAGVFSGFTGIEQTPKFSGGGLSHKYLLGPDNTGSMSWFNRNLLDSIPALSPDTMIPALTATLD